MPISKVDVHYRAERGGVCIAEFSFERSARRFQDELGERFIKATVNGHAIVLLPLSK